MENSQTFRPAPMPRVGERNAWVFSTLTVIGGVAFWLRFGALPGWFGLLAFFLLLSAALISLGNWVDRKTTLTLSPDGVAFRNGLRNVRLGWGQIEQLHVTADRWGQRVSLGGSAGSFNFRLLSQLEFQGKTRGQMGFPEGESILKTILQASGLRLIESSEQGRYYARP